MPSNNVSIEIFDQQKHLGTKNRPVRDTPDGDFGVVFRGTVHPLINLADYPAWSSFVSGKPLVWGIDITSGTYFDPNSCPSSESFSEIEAELVSTHIGHNSDINWFLDIGPFRCYVVLDGTPDRLEELVDQLGMHGLNPLNYGRSRRPASNGQTYDWFIRLSNAEDILSNEQQLRISLAEILGSENTTASVTTASVIRDLDDLGIKLTTDGTTIFYRGQIAKLSADLEESVRENKDALLDLLIEAKMTESSENAPDHASPDTGDLLEPVREMAEILLEDNISNSSIDSVLEDLTWFIESEKPENIERIYLHGFRTFAVSMVELAKDKANADLKNSKLAERIEVQAAKILEFELNVKASDRHSSNVETENDSEFTAQINSLTERLENEKSHSKEALDDWASGQEQLEDLESENENLILSINRLKSQLESVGETADLVESILLHTTPRVIYWGKSVDLLSSFSDQSSTLKKIMELSKGNKITSKNTAGAPGWRHVTVSTGKSNDGRLYYRTSSERIDVLLGIKSTQTRDIRRLRAL